MSGAHLRTHLRNSALAGVLLFGAQTANADTAMTAGTVIDEMPVRERTSYIMGIVEGLAYARFQRDTQGSGEANHEGMNCIYNWFYADSMSRLDTIEATFSAYADQFPAVILSAMVKRECGE